MPTWVSNTPRFISDTLITAIVGSMMRAAHQGDEEARELLSTHFGIKFLTPPRSMNRKGKTAARFWRTFRKQHPRTFEQILRYKAGVLRHKDVVRWSKRALTMLISWRLGNVKRVEKELELMDGDDRTEWSHLSDIA